MKKILKYIAIILAACIIGLCLMELVLRVHNPFVSRVKGDRILLGVNYEEIIRHEDPTGKLDDETLLIHNNLGFRGENLPEDFEDYLSIVTVGGGSTYCYYLTEDKTWPYILGEKLKESFSPFWINNAGLDGHSTVSHTVLLTDCLTKLKPKVIIFMAGVNDIERSPRSPLDEVLLMKKARGERIAPLKYLLKKSELVSALVNISRMVRHPHTHRLHEKIILEQLAEHPVVYDDDVMEKEFRIYREKYLKEYKKRLENIISICKENDIEPVFLTQPFLGGDVTDPHTGVYMGMLEHGPYNGIFKWELFKMYNEAVKEAGIRDDVLVIDLAVLLPKNSLYFYDFNHYTNEGAKKVSEIVYDGLKEHLKNKYGEFLR